jgi:hypothetical protein
MGKINYCRKIYNLRSVKVEALVIIIYGVHVYIQINFAISCHDDCSRNNAQAIIIIIIRSEKI